MNTNLLIDGDVLAHRFGSKHTNIVELNEEEPLHMCDEEALKADVEQFIKNLSEALEADVLTMLMSVPTVDGFRRRINPEYKSNRNHLVKPVGHSVVSKFLAEEYSAIKITSLEADDCIGIMMTNPTVKERRIACSVDKDFLSVPGFFYNWNAQELHETSELEADYMFYLQTLMGDAVDGYKGIPRVGRKTAEKILGPVEDFDPENVWATIVTAYESKDLTEEDALLNARMARILRHQDYNRKTKQPILWTP